MSVQPLFTPVRKCELDLPNSHRHGTAHPHARWADRSHADRAAGRILCPAGFGRTDRRGSDRDQSPNHVMREGRGQSSRSRRVSGTAGGAYAALTRGLAVHPGDAVIVPSGGELPRNFVDGHMIWKGI
jgi:hypothetical protein